MKKMALKEELVKFIFPGTSPTIALGEDGYIIHSFKSLYPEKLAIFIPSEVEGSNYNNVFPKSFEAYFRDADSEISHISRTYETDFGNKFKGLGVEYIPGRVLRRDENNFVVFRFDELVDPRRKTEVLCRAKHKMITTNEYIEILGTNPNLCSETTSLSGTKYLYWIMSLGGFFPDISSVLAATLFAMTE